MDNDHICRLALQIRSSPQNRTSVFTVSTKTLSRLLSSFDRIEEQSRSFNVMPTPTHKAELSQDLQYLHNYCRQAKALKLYSDGYDEDILDVTKFGSLQAIEFCRVDVNTVKGIQVLRSQLQKLVCQRTFNTLSDVLSDSGADKSHSYCWKELKELVFVNNGLLQLDESLDCAPFLHTLDLSHNELTNIEPLGCLTQLKHLNLSYNKLEGIPQLKGRICGRLQNFIAKNNFLEDIGGLQFFTSLCVLDLSNNCLIDHRSLLNVSHIATLQWLNLEGNPLSFHPNHRHRTVSYLHMNTSTMRFVLDQSPLSTGEKRAAGCFHPPHSKNSSITDSCNLAAEKVRKVRHVVIEEQTHVVIERPPDRAGEFSASSPRQYLETKRQIEDLHEKFGESWLNSHSGMLVHNVLGLESSLRLPSGSYEVTDDLNGVQSDKTELVEETTDIAAVVDLYEKPEVTAQDDVDVEGEESIYLATVSAETEPIFIFIDQTHITERECSTGNERARWHVDSIANCEILKDSPQMVQVDFETMRKDRKQRTYVFEEEIEAFVAYIKNKIDVRQPKKEEDTKYQCMKCSAVFSRVRNESVLSETAVNCPTCDSNLVVEYA